jgi:protein arginine kinase activator
MTCQRCPAEASVHLTEKVNGKVREVHLCGSCARKAGLPMGPPPEMGLDAVLEKLVLKHVDALVGDLARLRCPDCGLTFLEFRIEGRLGCPRDYETFAAGLTPLLRGTHSASRHVGKQPRRRRTSLSRLRLRALLREAIACENYEEAARLRDLLRQEDRDAS